MFAGFCDVVTVLFLVENFTAVRERAVPRVGQLHQPAQRQHLRRHRPRPARRRLHRLDAAVAAHHRIPLRQGNESFGNYRYMRLDRSIWQAFGFAGTLFTSAEGPLGCRLSM